MMMSIKTFTMSLYLMANLNCPVTKLENWTNDWTERDHKELMNAKRRCPQKYPNSPCLIFFRKKAQLTYNAICGAEY